jgi:hypothetical protein
LPKIHWLLCCEAFPHGTPAAIYPRAALREPRHSAESMKFKPKSGKEEIARRWAELEK